jgi:ferredoxin
MKIKIDQQKCIGCGSCQAVCPDIFEIGEDSKAHLKGSEGGDELKTDNFGCVQEATEICPVQAIEIEE